MRKKVIDILEKYTEKERYDTGVITRDDFINLATEIVKLFDISVVSNWLACKDELPEHGETVLTYTPLTEMASEQVRLMKYGTLKSGFPSGITHWQKIDKPTCY